MRGFKSCWCQARSMKGLLLALLLALVPTVAVRGDTVTLHVWENQDGSSYLGNLAQLANMTAAVGQEELTSLRYTLVERAGATSPLFRVDATTGDVFTTGMLDREIICDIASPSESCLLQLDVAVQSLTSAFFRKIAVNIRVHDENDNSPQFADSRVERSISETASVGSSLSLPAASDRDAPGNNSRITYALSTDTVPFSLRVSTAQTQAQTLDLVLTSQLDRESRDQYSFTVIASDGGSPSLSSTLPVVIRVLDSNDNFPVFQQSEYSAVLTETAAVDAPVVRVVARDLDLGDNAKVTYSFAEPVSLDVGALFAIDADSGQLRVQSSLENEGGRAFTFTVRAEDHGRPSKQATARVTVRILDTMNDAPRVNVKLLFSQDGVATVPEGAGIGRVAALVSVTDRDEGENGRVNCSLTSGHFALQRLDGAELKVVVARTLDREVTSRYNVTVTCRDFGSPPLSTQAHVIIKVLDENDNNPTFPERLYRLSVAENMPVGTVVGAVVARDADEGQNAAITYSLTPEAAAYFRVDGSGNLLTRQPLDRETTPSFSFNVTARDNGTSRREGHTAVRVEVTDINDEAPVFRNTSYHFRVLENATSGHVMGHVEAEDLDSGPGGEVRFFAEPASSGRLLPFTVQANGSVIVSGELDYEETRFYEFFATASDGGSPVLFSSVTVMVSVLDVNDNSPEIYFPSPGNDSIAIPHRMARGEAIARVAANDPDSGSNGVLRFVLLTKNASDLFRIDPATGTVFTGRDLTAEDVGRYVVILNVVDHGQPELSTQAVMVIDIFDDTEALANVDKSGTNTKIVIIMVVVTAALSIAVIATLFYLKYTDRRKLPEPESKPVPEKKPVELTVVCVSTDAKLLNTPQKRESHLAGGNDPPRPTKKSVTFVNEDERYCQQETPARESLSDSRVSQPVRRTPERLSLRGGCSVVNETSQNPQSEQESRSTLWSLQGAWTQPDSSHICNGTVSLYRAQPGSDVRSSWRQASNSVGNEISVTAALRQHQALVHSVRQSGDAQSLQVAGHDPEVWSATSGETTTSDSGHGGSDLDINCAKIAV